MDVRWTMKIFQELLEGVCYIHSMGVMHRDIKVSSLNELITLEVEENKDNLHYGRMKANL